MKSGNIINLLAKRVKIFFSIFSVGLTALFSQLIFGRIEWIEIGLGCGLALANSGAGSWIQKKATQRMQGLPFLLTASFIRFVTILIFFIIFFCLQNLNKAALILAFFIAYFLLLMYYVASVNLNIEKP